VREVAGRLGNTAAVCRKAYIHPAVLALAQPLAAEPAAGFDWSRLETGPAPARGLQAAERRLLRLLSSVRGEAEAGRGPASRRASRRAAPRPAAPRAATATSRADAAEPRAGPVTGRPAASPVPPAAASESGARRGTGPRVRAEGERPRTARATPASP
jgi:DNA topoisomerase-1